MTQAIKRNPELRMLVSHIASLAGWAPPVPITVTPLYFQGLIAGSEFLTYAANKLYLCLDLSVASQSNAGSSTLRVDIYTAGNVLTGTLKNCASYFNSVAAAIEYYPNNADIKNIYFSRILGNGYTQMKFVGYKLTI